MKSALQMLDANKYGSPSTPFAPAGEARLRGACCLISATYTQKLDLFSQHVCKRLCDVWKSVCSLVLRPSLNLGLARQEPTDASISTCTCHSLSGAAIRLPPAPQTCHSDHFCLHHMSNERYPEYIMYMHPGNLASIAHLRICI